MNTEEKIEDLKKQIAALEAEVNRVGNEYYTYTSHGAIFEAVWCDDPDDIQRLDLGLAFDTEEEARNDIKRRAATKRVLDIIAKHRGDVEFNWKNESQYKCYLGWENSMGQPDYMYTETLQFLPDQYHFPESAFDLITDEADPEDLKLFCGVGV